MLNIKTLFRNDKETGTLAEHCSVFGFIDDVCFITKTGAVGIVLRLHGIDYECLPHRDIDITTKRLEAAFKLFGPDYRVYQYLFKTHFIPPEPRPHENPIVNRAEQERPRLPLLKKLPKLPPRANPSTPSRACSQVRPPKLENQVGRAGAIGISADKVIKSPVHSTRRPER